MVQKQITSLTVQLVTIESDRMISDVITRLDEEINKSGSTEVLRCFQQGRSREELVEKIETALGDGDFLHFLSLPHGRWVNKYFAADTHPSGFMYTFGNPFMAARIMKHDICTGLHLPPRIFVTERDDRLGTKVIYHLPSSLVVPGQGDPELKIAADELDVKTERLILKILS